MRHAQDLVAPALAQAGPAANLETCIETGDEKAVLNYFEEGLRHGGQGVAVTKVGRLTMTNSRRWQLAAKSFGTMRIAIRR